MSLHSSYITHRIIIYDSLASMNHNQGQPHDRGTNALVILTPKAHCDKEETLLSWIQWSDEACSCLKHHHDQAWGWKYIALDFHFNSHGRGNIMTALWFWRKTSDRLHCTFSWVYLLTTTRDSKHSPNPKEQEFASEGWCKMNITVITNI